MSLFCMYVSVPTIFLSSGLKTLHNIIQAINHSVLFLFVFVFLVLILIHVVFGVCESSLGSHLERDHNTSASRNWSPDPSACMWPHTAGIINLKLKTWSPNNSLNGLYPWKWKLFSCDEQLKKWRCHKVCVSSFIQFGTSDTLKVRCFKGVKRVSHGCPQGCFKVVLRVYIACSKGVSKEF